MDDKEPQEIKTNNVNDDLDILIQNWKTIPVISTRIFMETFPYVLPPWDHWNQVIDTVKKEHDDTHHINNTTNTEPIHETNTIDVTTEAEADIEDNEDLISNNDDDPGYLTEVSEMDNTYDEIKSVDWENSDNEL